jgi:hypothetical protein
MTWQVFHKEQHALEAAIHTLICKFIISSASCWLSTTRKWVRESFHVTTYGPVWNCPKVLANASRDDSGMHIRCANK